MEIALVEDDLFYQAQLKEILSQLTLPFAVNFSFFTTGESLLFALEETVFTAVFLDIQLAGKLNGMETAKILRKTNSQLPLIFLSNYDDYVFDGYDVGAMSYIMKPITKEKLTALLEKLTHVEKKPTLLVETNEVGLLPLPLFEILYLEISGHTLKIVTQKKTFTTSGTLNSFDQELTGDFLQVHRSFTINLAQVVSLNGNEVLMKDGEKIPVARSQKQKLKDALLAYYRQKAVEND